MTIIVLNNKNKKILSLREAERRGNRLAYFIPKSSIIFLLSSTIFASKPSNHLQPLTQHRYQSSFRQNHDLSIFQESWPVIQISDPNNNNVQLSTISAFRVWYNNPIQSLAIQAAGQWETLSLMVEPVIVNDPYGPDILGTDYVRSGISGRITNGFIRYENDLITMQMGRAPLFWGQSIEHSIIQSTVTPSYDHIDLHLKFNRFRLEILSGQLGSELLQGERIKRNIAGHRLTWLSKNEKLFASFGEKIIYTGINRGFEWHYLNPFVPYFFTALEGDEESSANGDNDNSFLFTTIRYVYKPHLSLFGELLNDDFQVDENNYQDGLGYKIGADGAFDIPSSQDLDIDEVFFAVDLNMIENIHDIFTYLYTIGVSYHMMINESVHSYSDKHLNIRPISSNYYNMPMLSFHAIKASHFKLYIKNGIEKVFAVLLIIVSFPVLLLFGLLVYLTSKGPILFKQERVGLHGRKFYQYKLRSMLVDAEELKEQYAHLNEQSGPVFKIKNDPRLTSIGRFMRKYSIDELPQLFNILLGPMTLIGPRPPVPSEVKEYKDIHHRRLSMKPGITGLWQVSGRNTIHNFEEWVKLDLEYIDNWSFLMDLRIAVKTVSTVLSGTGM